MTDRPVKQINAFPTQATPVNGDFLLLQELSGALYKKTTPGDIMENLGAVSFGVAFPGSPSSGDQFFRTDLGLLCYFDGTRWLTMNQYTGFLEHTTAANANPVFERHEDTFGIFVDIVSVTTIVTVTNDGANFWTVTVKSHAPTLGAGADIYEYDTSADAVGTFNNHDGVDTQAIATPTGFFSIDIVSTLAPGSITNYVQVKWRYIIT